MDLNVKPTHTTHWPERLLHAFSPHLSLRRQVSLLIAIVVLLLSILLSTISGFISVRQTIQDRGQILDSLAQEHAAQFSRVMFERWREMQNIASYGPFTTEETTPAQMSAFLSGIQTSLSEYSWLGWVSPEGNIIASSGSRPENRNVSDEIWFQQGLQGPYVGDSPETAQFAQLLENPSAVSLHFIDFAVPASRNGTVLGVLGAQLGWRLTQEFLQPPTRGSGSAHAYTNVDILIINRDGIVIVGAPGLVGRSIPEVIQTTLSEALATDSIEGEHYQIVDWPDKGEYLIGYHMDLGYETYPGLGWIVLSRQPVETAFAPANQLQQDILSIGLLAGILFSVAGWWMATQTTQPLTQIVNAVRNVNDDEVDLSQIQQFGSDEVSTLGQALHTLITRLRSRNADLEALNATLEEQVSERTAAAESRTFALSQEIRIRQAVEGSLRESERRFRILAEASFEGLVVLSGRAIMDVNPALVSMFGYDSAAELVGMNLLELASPESHDRILESIQKNNIEPYEATGVHKNGTRFPVEIRGQWLASPEIELRVFAIRDLTLVKQAEEETRRRLEQLAALRRVDIELNARLDVHYVLNFALDAALRLGNATAGYIGLIEDQKLNMALVLGAPYPSNQPRIHESSLMILFADSTARRFNTLSRAPQALSLLHDDATAQMIFPLRSANHILGVLSLETIYSTGFDEETFQFIQLVAARIAVAVDNARLYETSQRQLSQVRSLSQTLAHQAEHDPLTGLANRLLFEQRLSEALKRAHVHAGIVAAGYIDLDHFKQINDKLGHDAGDELLRQVATRLLAAVGDRGTIARVGGDEFTLFVEVEGPEEVEAIASGIIESMTPAFDIRNHALTVSCSAGFSLYPFHTSEQNLLLRYADTALYQAKLGGRNTYAIYDPDVSGENVTRYAALEQDLEGAAERGEMQLVYQPKLDIEMKQITGVEALARWQHLRFGSIPPATFIPLAEETGIIVELGEWVLREACCQAMAWHTAGFPVSVAVNISATQLEMIDFVDRVAAIIDASGLAPQFVELEITESLFMHDFELKVQTLHRLRDYGVSLAIDDFGTGFSSLNYLRDLPVSVLKIDRSFVADLYEGSPRESRAYAIIEAIVTMAHALGMTVIAEGVEREYQVNLLRSLKSDGLQGYLLSRPMRASDITPQLAAHRPL